MKTRQQINIATDRKTVSARKPAVRRQNSKSRSGPTEEPFIPIKNDSRSTQTKPVHVEVMHPSARKVCIAGNFNGWNAVELARLGSGKWAIDLTLPRGSYEYRLVVDGQWMADPNAQHTVPNPFGEQNSLLVVL